MTFPWKCLGESGTDATPPCISTYTRWGTSKSYSFLHHQPIHTLHLSLGNPGRFHFFFLAVWHSFVLLGFPFFTGVALFPTVVRCTYRGTSRPLRSTISFEVRDRRLMSRQRRTTTAPSLRRGRTAKAQVIPQASMRM